MTLNSEGLKKAAHAIAADTPIGQMHRSREIAEKAISSYLSALPPVDGQGVVMEKICHKEQIGIWANEITSALALSDFLREEWTFDDSVDLEREIAAQLLDIIKTAFTHPALDLVASLSQASSVIAGLKDELADLRDEWQAEYDTRLSARRERITAERDALEAYCKLQAAEARISSLEEENKRLRAALEPFSDLAELILSEAPPTATMWHAFASHDGTEAQISLSYLRAARQAMEQTNG